ncbi:MAG: HAD family hydrolase [Chloroflexota bacterium]
MAYKLVALDIDGTICGPDLKLSDRLLAAVEKAQESGAVVTLATGRMLRSAMRFAKALGTSGPVVCYQGAIVADPVSGQVLRHERLQPCVARAALSIIDNGGSHINVYLEDHIYVADRNEWAVGYASRMELDLMVVDDLAPLADSRPTLVMAVDEPERVKAIAEEISSYFDGQAMVTHSIPRFCEVASPDAGKARALEFVTSRLRIKSSEVVAFGDGAGDVDMLEWAGLGVAVGDPHHSALEASDARVAGPDRDGVAVFLEDMLDRGLLGGEGGGTTSRE